MAVANYTEANGHYPPAYVLGPDGRPWHSWRVFLLPYIEARELHEEYNYAEPWDGPNNRKLAQRMPRVYAFHGSHRPNNTVTNYLAVVGKETLWPGAKKVPPKDVTDDPGTTVLIIENHGAKVHWMEPRDLTLDDMDFRINNPQGISSWYTRPAVTMLDGSLHRLSLKLKPNTLRGLLTIAGGEKFEKTGVGEWESILDGRLRERAP